MYDINTRTQQEDNFLVRGCRVNYVSILSLLIVFFVCGRSSEEQNFFVLCVNFVGFLLSHRSLNFRTNSRILISHDDDIKEDDEE